MTTLTMPIAGPVTQFAFVERVTRWLRTHRVSLALVVPLLTLGGALRLWNLGGTLEIQNDDGATYVAQAWAVLNGELAHYTYWYDHPPFGWMQIAGWAWVTDAFGRYGSTSFIGRELVAIYAVIAAGLLFVLCRRLGMNRFFSAFGMVLFLTSPLALSWAKIGFLDSLALPWVLASMVAARSPRRSGSSALWAAFFLAGAILTKETFVLFAPFVLWMIWQNAELSRRVRNVTQATVLMTGLGMMYILMATLKGELIPGEGHVSLVGSLLWQLVEREGSGYIFTPGTAANYLLFKWLEGDWWLLAAAAVMLPLALLRKELRPIAAIALIHVAFPLRGGYLPAPYIVAFLPLAPIIVAGGLNALWQPQKLLAAPKHDHWRRSIAAGLVMAFVALAGPSWTTKATDTLTGDNFAPAREVVTWLKQNVPASSGAQIIVENEIWLDLVKNGYDRYQVDWFFKLDVDSAVMKRYIPAGGTAADAWQSIDYVVIPGLGDSTIASRPTLSEALKHADLIATFGAQPNMNYSVYRVRH